MKQQRVYLQDILERSRRIQRYSTDGRDAFIQSQMAQDAVFRNFEVIGEIIKRLDPTLIAKHPQVPWSDIAGFRDFLIHHYDKILIEKVWDTIENDLEPLTSAVEALLRELTEE